jgi:WD40 repeat protein
MQRPERRLGSRCVAIITSLFCVAFSPDGKRVASGSVDNIIWVWNAKIGEAIGEPLHGHEESASVAFSPNGQCIVSGSVDTTIRMWNAETGEVIGEPLRGYQSEVTSIAFCADNRFLSCSVDTNVRLWDAEMREALGDTLYVQGGRARSAAFSPDYLRVALGSDDSTVQLWKTETGETVGGPLCGHNSEVFVASSADDQRIASGSTDGAISPRMESGSDITVRLWNARTYPRSMSCSFLVVITPASSSSNASPTFFWFGVWVNSCIHLQSQSNPYICWPFERTMQMMQNPQESQILDAWVFLRGGVRLTPWSRRIVEETNITNAAVL